MRTIKPREKEYALERVRNLKSKYPESAQVLDFYLQVLHYQQEVYKSLEGKEPDWRRGLKWFYRLLELCEASEASYLVERAIELKNLQKSEIESMISRFLKEKTAEDADRFLCLAFLGPFYQRLAENTDIDPYNWLKTRCPVCGFKPHVSYIADVEDIEGGRFLVCVLCGTEWLYNRSRCVKCGNEEDNSIDYYHQEEHRAVQLQACQKCGHYIKIVDLRVDGLAVPQVDDIATLTLDLWAREKNLLRFEKNILGL